MATITKNTTIKLSTSDIVAISEHIPILKPTIVYHYTSIETLMKILDGSTLRLTNLRDTNDVSEYLHGLRSLRERVSEYEDKLGISQKYRLTDAFFERCFFPNDLYFISFTEREDDTNYWNSRYVPIDKPIAIGFDSARLNNNRIKINRCYYIDTLPPLNTDQYILLRDMYFFPQNISGMGKRLFIHLTFELAHMKNTKFNDEGEWRVVTFPANDDKIETFTRWGKACRGFYMPFDLCAIEKIIIGPGENMEVNYGNVCKLVTQYGLQSDVVKSTVPLRL